MYLYVDRVDVEAEIDAAMAGYILQYSKGKTAFYFFETTKTWKRNAQLFLHEWMNVIYDKDENIMDILDTEVLNILKN